MKKIMRLSALCIAGLVCTATATAQVIQVPTVCVKEAELTRVLGEFQESAMLTMTSIRVVQGDDTVDLPMVLFANPVTGTWTLVERRTSAGYCVLASGGDIRPYHQGR